MRAIARARGDSYDALSHENLTLSPNLHIYELLIGELFIQASTHGSRWLRDQHSY